MEIGLIDVDGAKSHGNRFPNLALMKISAFHKKCGDSVEMAIPIKWYDRIYASKVFTFTPDIDYIPQTNDFRKGGTGYFYPDGGDPLPDEIEHIMPDYSLYGITDTAYGFLSRGCPRGCDFCIVAKKEGRASRKVADLSEWWNGQKNIVLMDPNILACLEWRDLLGQLADSRATVDISQGTDIRMMTPEKAEALNKIRTKDIHFAWDRADQDLAQMFADYAKVAKKNRHGKFGTVYCLTNFDTTMEWNLYRIYTLRDLGYDPYVMVFDKQHAPRDVLRLQRWCNNKFIFNASKRFEDYCR